MSPRKKQRHNDLHAKQLQRLHSVMKAFGLLDEYQRLKPAERDHVLKFQGPAPKDSKAHSANPQRSVVDSDPPPRGRVLGVTRSFKHFIFPSGLLQ